MTPPTTGDRTKVVATEPIVDSGGSTTSRVRRRRILKMLLASSVAAVGWSVGFEPLWIQVTHQTLSVPNLPEQWVGKRMVHISDLHVGRTNQSHLLRAMHRVNSLSPDILVITGDFVDRHYPVDDRLDAVLQDRKSVV